MPRGLRFRGVLGKRFLGVYSSLPYGGFSRLQRFHGYLSIRSRMASISSAISLCPVVHVRVKLASSANTDRDGLRKPLPELRVFLLDRIVRLEEIHGILVRSPRLQEPPAPPRILRSGRRELYLLYDRRHLRPAVQDMCHTPVGQHREVVARQVLPVPYLHRIGELLRETGEEIVHQPQEPIVRNPRVRIERREFEYDHPALLRSDSTGRRNASSKSSRFQEIRVLPPGVCAVARQVRIAPDGDPVSHLQRQLKSSVVLSWIIFIWCASGKS